MIVKHLNTRVDIENVVHAFYQSAIQDDEIGYVFTEVAKLDLKEHLPRIIDFWESVLFGTASYQGNPVLKHVELHRMSKLTKDHFERWLMIWNRTIDEEYKGEKASEAKDKAQMMANLMMYKIAASDGKGFVQ